MAHAKGTPVRWKWGNGYGHGRVQSVFTRKVTRKIDGKEIVRHGSDDNPAYYIHVDGGNNVLKLQSEIERE
jgi:hypothetical protein